VLINGRPAKASASVKAGDVVTIQFGNKEVKVEVLDVQETVRKEEAKELFRYLP
jgi:ribosomal 50S subunit-recycling heat shock protein